MDPDTNAHHSVHLIFLVEDKDEMRREVHTHVYWPQERDLPHPESHFRFEPGTVFFVQEVTVNAFPELEGSLGDIVLSGQMLADGTVMPLMLTAIEELLNRKSVKSYRGGHYGK